jgi:hypothetical protein
VSAALAAAGSPQPQVLPASSIPSYLAPPTAAAAPAVSYASFYQSNPPTQAAQVPRATGGPLPAAAASSRTAPLRAAVGGPLGAASEPQAALMQPALAAAACSGEDPLARARRQVLAAKSYLRQVAEMGGRTAGSS